MPLRALNISSMPLLVFKGNRNGGPGNVSSTFPKVITLFNLIVKAGELEPFWGHIDWSRRGRGAEQERSSGTVKSSRRGKNGGGKTTRTSENKSYLLIFQVEEEAGSTVSLTPRSPTTSSTTSPTTTTTPLAPTVEALATPGSSIASSNQQQEQELASISAELRELAASNNNKTANAAPGSPQSDLESENARLKEQRTCKICMDNEVGVVFLPCGHLCSCVLYAPSLKDCPVCRTNIQGTVRTFLS